MKFAIILFAIFFSSVMMTKATDRTVSGYILFSTGCGGFVSSNGSAGVYRTLKAATEEGMNVLKTCREVSVYSFQEPNDADSQYTLMWQHINHDNEGVF